MRSINIQFFGGRGSGGSSGKRGSRGAGGRPEGDGSWGQDGNGHKYTEKEYKQRLAELNEYDPYHYHATTIQGLVGIRRSGAILPNEGRLGSEVYMAKTASSALEWTADTSTGGTVLTRVSNKYLAKTDYTDYDRTKGGEGSTSRSIPISQVQVKTTAGPWISAKDAVVSWVGGKPTVIKRPKRR